MKKVLVSVKPEFEHTLTGIEFENSTGKLIKMKGIIKRKVL